MKKYLVLILLLATACENQEVTVDAYGTLDAEVIKIFPETNGKITGFQLHEGQDIAAGQVVATVDTAMLHLQREQLRAQGRLIETKTPNLSLELAVIDQEISTAKAELQRFENLAESGAATQKQVDDLRAMLAMLARKRDAAAAKNLPVAQELELLQVQIEQVELQISKASIKSPIRGTVLQTLAHLGEMAMTGVPIAQIADLDSLTAKAFVTAEQLLTLKLGQQVEVWVDAAPGEYAKHNGTITWFAQQAEFTPKNIQTQPERATLVYAIEIKVPNDGSLKIGMPVEIHFGQKQEE